MQQEKDQIEIALNNKIEILQYKLLNGNDGFNNNMRGSNQAQQS